MKGRAQTWKLTVLCGVEWVEFHFWLKRDLFCSVIYGKQLTSDSSWEFFKIENVQLKTVQNNYYKQNSEEAVNFVTWYKGTSAVKPDSKSLYCRTYAIKNYETVEIYP